MWTKIYHQNQRDHELWTYEIVVVVVEPQKSGVCVVNGIHSRDGSRSRIREISWFSRSRVSYFRKNTRFLPFFSRFFEFIKLLKFFRNIFFWNLENFLVLVDEKSRYFRGLVSRIILKIDLQHPWYINRQKSEAKKTVTFYYVFCVCSHFFKLHRAPDRCGGRRVVVRAAREAPLPGRRAARGRARRSPPPEPVRAPLPRARLLTISFFRRCGRALLRQLLAALVLAEVLTMRLVERPRTPPSQVPSDQMKKKHTQKLVACVYVH